MTSGGILRKLKSAFENLSDLNDEEEAGPPRGVPMASPRSLKSPDLLRLPFEGTIAGFLTYHRFKFVEEEPSFSVNLEKEKKEPS